MTLQQLKYIVTVAEKGTISEAAKELFISQPSLTNAIKDLENEMNVSIFNRTNRGIVITHKGNEFLSYARQVLEQANLLEEKFLGVKNQSPYFSVSSQHYSFAVNAFVEIIRQFDADKYEFTLKETQTNEIIDDVSRLKSEVGVLYMYSKNEEILLKLIKQNGLEYEEIYSAHPHIFVSSKHPLADRELVYLDELEDYPYLSYEQGDYSAFYFSEEILSTLYRKKHIKVRDRATLFNLAIGLNGYTVSSGIICKELNGESIISIPLAVDERMNIGIVTKKDVVLSRYAVAYIERLKANLL